MNKTYKMICEFLSLREDKIGYDYAINMAKKAANPIIRRKWFEIAKRSKIKSALQNIDVR
jgi:hypothetical protein